MADSPQRGYSLTVIAGLLKLTEVEVQQLAKQKIIPSPDRNGLYDLIAVIRSYITYLRDKPMTDLTLDNLIELLNITDNEVKEFEKQKIIIKNSNNLYDLEKSIKGYINYIQNKINPKLNQDIIAEHLDMTPRNWRDVFKKLVVKDFLIDGKRDIEFSLFELTIAYIRYLREIAAGRGGESQELLVQAKTRQADVDTARSELALLKDIKKVVYVKDVEHFFANEIITCKKSIIALAKKWQKALKITYQIHVESEFFEKDIVDRFNRMAAALPNNVIDPDNED